MRFGFQIDNDTELSLLEERHAEELFAWTDQNRDHLRAWMPWVDKTKSVSDSLDFIRRSLQQFAHNEGFVVGIWHRGQLAGDIGYTKIDWTNRKCSIGYGLGKLYEGKGLATKACRVLVDHAFAELALHRLEIHCAPENVRSRAIPERLGFTQEGLLRQAAWLNDHYVDLVLYALLANEWQDIEKNKKNK